MSKFVDTSDWETTTAFFDILSTQWGPFTIDRFASPSNTKVTRFDSKFFVQSSAGVDAFSHCWEGDNNYLVLPVDVIIRIVGKFVSERVTGTFVIPFWQSSAF